MNKIRSKFPRAFTLVEMMIVVIILAIVAAVALKGLAGCSSCQAPTIKANAERYAAHYARTFLSWNTPVVECQGEDNDNNNYVMCNIAQQAGGQMRQVECPANYWYQNSTGCRAYGLRTYDVNGQPVQVQQVPGGGQTSP